MKYSIPALLLASFSLTAIAGEGYDHADAVRACRAPDFPASVRREGRDGTVTVRYLLDEQGAVTDARIAVSSGESALDEAAMAAGRACKLPPVQRAGYAVRAWVSVQYVFMLPAKNEYISALRAGAQQGDPKAAGELAAMRLKFIWTVPGWSEKDAVTLLAAAAAHDADAAMELGRYHGRNRRSEAALNAYEAAAELGHMKAGYELGRIYSRTPFEDHAKAFRWYLHGAEAGDPAAQRAAAQAYVLGKGTAKNVDEALRWANAAAAQGDVPSMLLLAREYQNRNGKYYRIDQAIKLFGDAAKQGNVEAQYAMGFLNFSGEGMPKDRKAAWDYWLQAAEQGHERSQYALYFYLKELDPEASQRWLQQAAAFGYAPAQTVLGSRIHNQPPDAAKDKEMVEWYRKAAAQGHPTALNNLGDCYETGRGVPMDLVEAKRWYEQAVAKNSDIGLVSLGGLAEREKRYEEALKLYTRAADTGFAQGLYEQARLVEAGMGTQADKPRALQSYLKAAEKGNRQAMRRLIRVYESGELGQKANAAAAREWQDKLAARPAL